MSLKAKLEAVIYAAEEPVTLAQLAGLFADEALELKAEREAAVAREAEEAAAVTAELPLEIEGIPAAELEVQAIKVEAEVAAEGVAAASVKAEAETEPETAAETEVAAEKTSNEGEAQAAAEGAAETGAEAVGDQTAETASEDPAVIDEAAAEAAAKRAAKQRDREARSAIRQLLSELIEEYDADGRGIEIREIAGGYRMATKPQCHDAVRLFVKSLKPPLKLSLPALETLAVIAYKQPVTAPEVNEIRGVDSSGVFGSLLARKLITTAGRKPVVGRPILYKTTREFLLRFGLKDVSELPSMEEFEKLAASELEETESAPENAADRGEAAEEFSPDMSVEAEQASHEAGDGAPDGNGSANANDGTDTASAGPETGTTIEPNAVETQGAPNSAE